MKHHLIPILAAALLLPHLIRAEERSIADLTTITAAGINTAADTLLVRDVSAANPQARQMTIAELWKSLGGTNVSTTELGYLDGVTSAVQTQLDAKQASVGFVTLPPSGTADSNSRTVPRYVVADDVGTSFLHRVPASSSKRLIISGTSTAAGGVATSYAVSWAGKLTTEMEARGWTVTNRGFSGLTIAEVRAKLHASILSWRPDAIIFVFGFNNEGIYTAGSAAARETVYQTAIANLEGLIRDCHTYGVNLVISLPLTSTASTADYLTYHERFREWFEARDDVGLVTFVDSLVDSNWVFLSGTNGDAVHANDVGHQIFYDSLPASIFETTNKVPKRVTLSGSTNQTNGASTGWKFTPDKPISSFTTSVWVKGVSSAGTNPMGFVSSITGSVVNRMRYASSVYSFQNDSSGAITSTVSGDGNTWHHIAVSYNDHTSTWTLYIDGTSIGTLVTANENITSFVFGCRGDETAGFAHGGEYRDIAVYRVALHQAQITQLASGRILRAGLDAYAPLSDPLLPADGSIRYFPTFGPTKSKFSTASTSTVSYTPRIDNGTMPGLFGTLTANGIATVCDPLSNLSTNRFTVRSSEGDTSIFAGRIETTRSTLFLNYDERAFDANNGALTIAAGTKAVRTSGSFGGTEISTPSAPAANGWTLYAEDNGSGKTRLMVRFASGASQQIAIEP